MVHGLQRFLSRARECSEGKCRCWQGILPQPLLYKNFSKQCRILNAKVVLCGLLKANRRNITVNLMTCVHDLTTVIKFGYFDTILKECIGKTLKFLLDNGRVFIIFCYVTGKLVM